MVKEFLERPHEYNNAKQYAYIV